MAVMSNADRALVSAEYQRGGNSDTGTFSGVVKADIRAAVNAVDDWAVANAASFNSALPVAARNNLTATQKARLLMFVIKKRYEVGA